MMHHKLGYDQAHALATAGEADEYVPLENGELYRIGEYLYAELYGGERTVMRKYPTEAAAHHEIAKSRPGMQVPE